MAIPQPEQNWQHRMKTGSFTTNLVHMPDSGKLAHKARLQRGLSQRELANGICSAAHISRLERGRCLPSPKLLLQLAGRLEVNVDDLVRSYLQSGPAVSALAELAVELTTEAQLNLAHEVLDRTCEQLSPGHASYQRDVANVYRARSYWHQVEGNMARAQHLARKRLEVVRQLRSNPFVRADAYYQVGSLALHERQLDQAEEHLRRAWYEVQRVDLDAPPVARQRAETLCQRVVWALGLVFLYNRETTHAHMLYEQARYLWDELAFEQPVPLQLQSNMALAHIAAGDFEQADELLELILNAAGASDRDRVRALTNLGLSQRLQERYQEAQKALQEAWTLASETGQGNLHAISDELSRLALLAGGY